MSGKHKYWNADLVGVFGGHWLGYGLEGPRFGSR